MESIKHIVKINAATGKQRLKIQVSILAYSMHCLWNGTKKYEGSDQPFTMGKENFSIQEGQIPSKISNFK
ncbi:hypothetical protein QQG55_41845 [Brugia pahangi]